VCWVGALSRLQSTRQCSFCEPPAYVPSTGTTAHLSAMHDPPSWLQLAGYAPPLLAPTPTECCAGV
jgi:hypothetical protein